ncbi:MAG: Acetate kinase [uncultured Friedmanniella sp.]|uniref:Acetate kinase n=1 Tax=uncultured Friedmanniella sp. TaxID=335381 RepID=A0A6J4KY09_9ACTN|nr:acetate kinase [uncultured Friedmanniella sp.]CAA9317207.1 MAG: Acetate kinase [uncultured Friedmanniella sp.]
MTADDAASGPVLVLNAGSSSLKYQLVEPASGAVRAKGTIERIGESGSAVSDHASAVQQMSRQIVDAGVDLATAGIRAVGHRVVHGGPDFSDPVVLDDDVVDQISALSPLAPLHNPGAVAGIRAARAHLDVPHVAVFDTAFFATLPAAARTYALPRDLADRHRIRRYGMHGTSHRYVSRAVPALLGRPLAELNQVVLHLGNGCSASAVRGGRAVDTSMGLTPLQGLVMGTRSGDVDPGLHSYLHRELGLSIAQIDDLLNKQSGLRGLSGVNDFRALQELRAAGDEHAELAFEIYVHRLKHYLGAYLVQLGRLDVLSFTAGVGENNPALRAAVVEGLGGLGLSVDPARNRAPSREARVISPDGSRVTVAVVPTNEELEIARQAVELLGS